MEVLLKLVGVILLAIILSVVFGALLAFPTKWLWNDVIVYLFNFKEISAFQAWELLVLCSLLFKTSSSSSSK